MSRLVPLSPKKMKELGITKSKNGFLMNVVVPKNKSVKKSEVKTKTELKSKVVEKPVKEKCVQEVVVVQKNAKQIETKRLEDRGIYK